MNKMMDEYSDAEILSAEESDSEDILSPPVKNKPG